MSNPMKDHTVLAYFESPRDLIHAAEKVRDAGYKKFDTFSPFPIHGMDQAMGLKPSMLGYVSALGSLALLSVALLLEWWTSTQAYPIVVSGKPLFSYQAFVPIMFELAILGAALAVVLGMFHFNKLGFLYHPLFNSEKFKKIGDDGFALGIEVTDPLFDQDRTLTLLKSLKSIDIEMVGEEQ